MLDSFVMAALIERCVPTVSPAPIAKIIYLASGGEPLSVVAIEKGRVIPMQASTKSEAIALATEARLAGAPLKVGLAGIDSRDLDRLGVSMSDAFEPCVNIRAAARLLAENKSRSVPTDPVRPSRRDAAPLPYALPTAEPSGTSDETGKPTAAEPAPRPAWRSWDVYAQGLESPTLVYGVRD